MPVEELPHDPNLPERMGGLRADAVRALGDFELGVRRATDTLAAAIARASAPHELATFEQITAHSADFLRAVDGHLASLLQEAESFVASDPLVAQDAREGLRRWHAELAQYVAGFVEGGGIALGLYLSLPEAFAAYDAQVAAVLAERVAFIPQRAERAMAVWIAEIRGHLDARGDARLRLERLVRAAEALGVRPRQVPERPTEEWFTVFEERLRQIAADRGVPVPPELDVLPTARVSALLDRASRSGLRLGRIPSPPTQAWVDETEARLEQAIARRAQDQAARERAAAATREARVRRLVAEAAELGEHLEVPMFVTDDWLDRAELRVTSFVLTPMRVGRTIDPQRAGRMRAAWAEDERRQDRPDPTPRLVMEEGTVQEQGWRIEEEVTTVGRHRSNAVQIRFDPLVSRRHCTIIRTNGAFLVRNEGSAKGTIVNGVQVEEARLADGDVLLLGDTRLVFYPGQVE